MTANVSRRRQARTRTVRGLRDVLVAVVTMILAFVGLTAIGGRVDAATTRTCGDYSVNSPPRPAVETFAERVDADAMAGPATAPIRRYGDSANVARTSAPRVSGFFAPQTPGGECEPGGFWRGSRPGQPVSFEPMPNEYRVDATTGFVKPTHGVSVFDNPESVVSKGFEPHRIDLTSIPSDLQIIQRGNDPHHYEITPRSGTSLLPEEYAALLRRIRTLG